MKVAWMLLAGLALPAAAADLCSPRLPAKERAQPPVTLVCDALRAANAGDADAIGQLMAADYFLVMANGHVMPHPKPAMTRRWVAAAKAGTVTRLVAVDKARDLGAAAVVSGRLEERSRRAGGDQCTTRSFTDLWEKRGERWTWTQTHESGLAETPCGD